MRSCLLFILIFLSLNIFGQYKLTNKQQAIHNNILDLDFVLANKNISKLPASLKSSGAKFWLSAYSIFIEAVVSSNTQNDKQLIASINKQISSYKALNFNSPYYNYYLVDMYFFRAYLEFKHDDYIKSVRTYFRAQQLIDENLKLYPSFILNKKHQLINIVAHFIVQKKAQFFSSSLKRGNIEQEYDDYVNALLSSSEVPQSIKREIRLLAVLLNKQIESKNNLGFAKACSYSTAYYLIGPLECFAYAETAQLNNSYSKAYLALQSADSLNYPQKFSRLNLMFGVSQINIFEQHGVSRLLKYINNQQNSIGVAYAYLKLAWFEYYRGRVHESYKYVNKILITQADNYALDKQAKFEINNYANWDSTLLKVRFLFDAGNYKQAINILICKRATISMLNESQQLEYAYRLARSYHLDKQYKKAITFYKISANTDFDSQFYYPVYSAYYLGLIYKQQNNYKDAKYFLNKCINMDSPVYKISIHKKAKQIINQIE